MQGAQVQSLVRELDPACMLQLRSPHATKKIPRAATKTWHSQKKKKKKDKISIALDLILNSHFKDGRRKEDVLELLRCILKSFF